MMIESIIKPKNPILTKGWVKLDIQLPINEISEAVSYYHERNRLQVISSVDVVSDDSGKLQKEPHYHISITKLSGSGATKKRATSDEAKWVLGQFGMPEGEEDNHARQGFMRSFWRPVADRLVGIECECKEEEIAIKLDKGDYVWRPR